jgi:hypothetical protein
LHRDVERRGRLVEEKDVGIEDQGAGDGDALALPARELVGLEVAKLGVEADKTERVGNRGGGAGKSLVAQGFEELGADRLARVERAVGVLEDHLDGAEEVARSHVRHRGAGDGDLALVAGIETGDRPEDGRLPAARLADEA